MKRQGSSKRRRVGAGPEAENALANPGVVQPLQEWLSPGGAAAVATLSRSSTSRDLQARREQCAKLSDQARSCAAANWNALAGAACPLPWMDRYCRSHARMWFADYLGRLQRGDFSFCVGTKLDGTCALEIPALGRITLSEDVLGENGIFSGRSITTAADIRQAMRHQEENKSNKISAVANYYRATGPVDVGRLAISLLELMAEGATIGTKGLVHIGDPWTLALALVFPVDHDFVTVKTPKEAERILEILDRRNAAPSNLWLLKSDVGHALVH